MSVLERFWQKVIIGSENECWPWTSAKQRGGYGAFGIVHGTIVTASVFSWEVANERAVPKGLWVLHTCDNPPCCNPAHLYIGTRQDNVRDMVNRRRHWAHRGDPGLKGETNGRAKLTSDQVREIREMYATGAGSQTEIGKLFGVTRTVVGNIARGESWKHVA